MKPTPNTLVRESSLEGKKTIEFSIGDPRWVMRTSAKMYSDISTAIIREYSTNAWDAHVMAGHTDPIEITLPSLMEPFFVVRDHGVGMNVTTFEEIYTQFGISDKRERMDTNGQLGYGSKSGVAYTTQFTVTSVRDGIKTEALVERMPDWSIIMTIVDEDFTEEHNGTVIRIPVHNVDEFNHKAREFYKFWLPGRVLIDGKPHTHYVGEQITDNLYHSKDWATSYVVLGNVAYRIANPAALFRDTKIASLNFVAYVDDFKTVDGAQPVEFVPSREDLEYSDRTKETLQAIVNQFERDIVAKAKAEIEAATTHAEAYAAWSNWTDTLGRAMFADLTFKGDKFKSDFDVPGWRYRLGRSRGGTIRIKDWNVEAMENTMVVTDFKINISSGSKAKANQYVTHMGWDTPTYIIFTPEHSINCKWVDWSSVRMVAWDDLKAALPKVVRTYNSGGGYGRLAGSWDYFTRDGKTYESSIPDDVSEIYYITIQREKSYNVPSILQTINSDAAVLLVPANRLAKLNREHSEITDFITTMTDKVVRDGRLLLSTEAKAALNVSPTEVNWARALDLTRVDDPRFQKALDATANKDKLMYDYNQNLRLAEVLRMQYTVTKFEVSYTDLYKTYPLLKAGSSTGTHEHVYMYLNAAYAAELEKKSE